MRMVAGKVESDWEEECFVVRQGEQRVKEGFSTLHTTLQQRAFSENPKHKAEDRFQLIVIAVLVYMTISPGKLVAFPRRRKMINFCMHVSCQSSRQTSLWPLRTTQFMFLCRSLCELSVIRRLETGTCYFPWKT